MTCHLQDTITYHDIPQHTLTYNKILYHAIAYMHTRMHRYLYIWNVCSVLDWQQMARKHTQRHNSVVLSKYAWEILECRCASCTLQVGIANHEHILMSFNNQHFLERIKTSKEWNIYHFSATQNALLLKHTSIYSTALRFPWRALCSSNCVPRKIKRRWQRSS